MTPQEAQAGIEALMPHLRACCLAESKMLREPYDECWPDVLLGAWRALASWDPDGGASRRTWVARHAHWACVDGHRARTDWTPARPRPLSLTAIMETEVPGAPMADTWPDPAGTARIEEVDDAAAAESILSALHPRQRLVARAHWVDGLTVPEIAAATGLPRTTVRGRLDQAIRVLRASRREPIGA